MSYPASNGVVPPPPTANGPPPPPTGPPARNGPSSVGPSQPPPGGLQSIASSVASSGGNSSQGGGPGGGGGGGSRKSGNRHDDEEQGKLFVGGLSWDTNQESLLHYFGRFGEVIDCVVMKNPDTGRSRGFGFVTFSDPNNIDAVLASCPHNLDGRTIDPKSCNPRSQQKPKLKTNNTQHNFPKVFLGGLPSSITETDLRSFFSRYGEVVEVVIMYDQEKKKSRGFGFLSFGDDVACSRAVAEHFVNIQNKQVEIKRAEPRTNQQGDPLSPPGSIKDMQGHPHHPPSQHPGGHPPVDQWGTPAPNSHPPMGGAPNGHHHHHHHPPATHHHPPAPQTGHYGQWGHQAPPPHSAPAPHQPQSTAYPPQYGGNPPPPAGSNHGPPPHHQTHWAQPPPTQAAHPAAAAAPAAPHWGQPPPAAQPAQQPTQYPGAVYPPPTTPQPPQPGPYWAGQTAAAPPAPHDHYASPPLSAHSGHTGAPKDYYSQPAAQVTAAAQYAAQQAAQAPAYSQPSYGAQPPHHVKPAEPTYTSAAPPTPGSYYGAPPASEPVPGNLVGPQRGAVYGAQPPPYHPYRRL